MHLWRLTEYPSLDGEGGCLYSGRWHTAGSPITYLAASPPGALVEILVHLELDELDLPPAYKLLRIGVPSRIRIAELRIPANAAWRSDLDLTRRIGDTWLRSKRSALARVPSVIMPNTFNYLLNPVHADAAHIRIEEVTAAVIDDRLLRR